MGGVQRKCQHILESNTFVKCSVNYDPQLLYHTICQHAKSDFNHRTQNEVWRFPWVSFISDSHRLCSLCLQVVFI